MAAIDGRRIAFCIPGEPDEGFFSQIAMFNLALRKAPAPWCDARLIAFLGTLDEPAIPERWRPFLRDVDVRFVKEDVRRNGPKAQEAARFSVSVSGLDYVIMSDADTLLAGQLDEAFAHLYFGTPVAGVIAHYPPPGFKNPGEAWRRLSVQTTGRPIPLGYFHTLVESAGTQAGDTARAPFYANHGFLALRADALKEAAPLYLQTIEDIERLVPVPIFAGQMAMALTVHAMGWQPVALPMRFNFPNDEIALRLHRYESNDVRILHYLREHNLQRRTLFANEGAFNSFLRRELPPADQPLRAIIEKITDRNYPF